MQSHSCITEWVKVATNIIIKLNLIIPNTLWSKVVVILYYYWYSGPKG